MKKKINFKPHIIAGSISFGFGVFMFCLISVILKMPALDGTAYAAVILISLAGLIWIAREGFFDIFSYGFRQLGSTIFSKTPNEYNNFAGYKEYKNQIREKRSKYYITVALVGAVFLLATFILFIIYKLS